MATLNLEGQAIAHGEIEHKLVHLKSLMDARKVMWDKLSTKQKRRWVTSEKDLIMNIAWSVYRYLDRNFFGDEVNNEIQ